jgi:hypothetical protein
MIHAASRRHIRRIVADAFGYLDFDLVIPDGLVNSYMSSDVHDLVYEEDEQEARELRYQRKAIQLWPQYAGVLTEG